MPSGSDELEYWDKKATELKRGQLETIQASATRWTALLTALLGAFSAVAFAGGLTTLDKLASPYAFWSKLVTTLAVGCAVGAIVCLAIAAGGIQLTRASTLSGLATMRLYEKSKTSALGKLKLGRYLASGAAGLVIAGSILALWADPAEPNPTPPKVLAVVGDGLVCGELGRANDGITIDGASVLEVTELTVVDACP